MRGKGILFGLAAVAVVGLLVSFFAPLERMLVFFPTREVALTPGDAGLEFEDVFIETAGGERLHGWYVPGRREETWVWFHGNGGNVGHRVEELAQFHRRLGVNQFIFDYRGYGNSDGAASVENTHQDARAALEYVRGRGDVDGERVVYFGRSLGAAVAVQLAVEHRPLGMVLVSPFTSLRDMAKAAYPGLPFLPRLVGSRYDSLKQIPQVDAPLLVIHGQQDDIVPVEQGIRLFEAASEPKSLVILPTAGHNDTYEAGGGLYWRSLAGFLDSLPR